jgi:hypothetical protein
MALYVTSVTLVADRVVNVIVDRPDVPDPGRCDRIFEMGRRRVLPIPVIYGRAMTPCPGRLVPQQPTSDAFGMTV